jgi:hypothetical protein
MRDGLCARFPMLPRQTGAGQGELAGFRLVVKLKTGFLYQSRVDPIAPRIGLTEMKY